MKILFFLLILFFSFSIIPASADFLEDLMNQKIIGTVDELPYARPNPEMNWQTSESGHIKGWIDIVGFRNLSRAGGVFYTYGDITKNAILDYDAIGSPPGIIDDLAKTITFAQSGNKLTASLAVVMKWHTVVCDKKGCFINGRFTDTAVFQDTDTVPQQFVMPDNQSVLLKHYTGEPYHPNILVFDVAPAVTEIHASTANASITHYVQIGVVNYTAKNVPFMEISPFNKWEQIGGNGSITSFINEVVTDENFTSVSFMTAYGGVGANITEKTMESSHIHWEIFGILFVVGVILYGVYRMWVKASS